MNSRVISQTYTLGTPREFFHAISTFLVGKYLSRGRYFILVGKLPCRVKSRRRSLSIDLSRAGIQSDPDSIWKTHYPKDTHRIPDFRGDS